MGAGKTTRALELACDIPAARFSLDEWIVNLYGKELPESMTMEWWADHAARASSQIWAVCQQILALDRDVVLDFGFGTREQRKNFRALARLAGANVKLHVVVAESSERRRRVISRNQGTSPTFALRITDAMFDASESWWEPPTIDEAE